MIRRRFTVHGKVQGVWFRASTREKALSLGLSGHAANLADGSVEVHAQGDQEAVDRLGLWLQEGPALAKVSRVEMLELELRPSESGFGIQ